MKTTTLYRHRNLGGAWTITTTPRYPDSEKLAPEFDVVATFSGSEAGQIGLGAFIAGLRLLIGASLYNEETRQFDVGTVAELDAA